MMQKKETVLGKRKDRASDVAPELLAKILKQVEFYFGEPLFCV